ncbi:hypothetical protein ACOME3_002808 [Neoechinorhynchus agilis]
MIFLIILPFVSSQIAFDQLLTLRDPLTFLIHTNDEQFSDLILNADRSFPVLAVFTATQTTSKCSACIQLTNKALIPLASSYSRQSPLFPLIIILDPVNARSLYKRFSIRQVPSVFLLKTGRQVPDVDTRVNPGKHWPAHSAKLIDSVVRQRLRIQENGGKTGVNKETFMMPLIMVGSAVIGISCMLVLYTGSLNDSINPH